MNNARNSKLYLLFLGLSLGILLVTLEACKAADAVDDGGIDAALSDLRVNDGSATDAEAGILISTCARTGWTEMVSRTTQDLLAIWGASAQEIYAVGAAGTILHFDGVNWTPMTVPPGSASRVLRSVWGSRELGVLAVGSSGAILHHDGLAWRELSASTPAATGFNAVHIMGESAVVAGTSVDPDLSSIYSYDGSLWRNMADRGAPSGATINGLWSLGEQELIAVGAGESPIHRFNGQRWLSMPLPSSVEVSSLTAIWGAGSENIYAVGQRSGPAPQVVLHFNGAHWSRLHAPDLSPEARYTALWGETSGEILAVAASQGVGSTIRQFSGGSWRDLSLPERVQRHFINQLWSPDPGQLFAVGKGGAILHWCRVQGD